MKSIRVFMLPLGLVSVVLVLAAFMNMRVEKAMSDLQTRENDKGFAVVELFTSEGCSSCPPADELVARIQKENENKQIYILAFHVDYWDHQGWKDTFSDPEYSNRQRQYASWMNLQSVYTPQIVVNGTSEYVGSDESHVARAISAGLDKGSATALELNCKIEGRKVKVEYQGAVEEKRSELVLALVQKSAQSNVRAGENSGRRLSHVQIVRGLVHVPVDMNNKKSAAMNNDKKSITMDLPGDYSEKGWEIIGFVQHKTDGRITAAGRFEL